MKRISLMFSGGVDSTAAALELSRHYDEVHLLTFANGYGHYKIGRTAKRFQEVERHATGRVFHQIESIQPLFKQLAPSTLLADLVKYQSGFVWCMGCKLAMHAHQIAYDHMHGITEATDGSSSDTSEMVEQTLLSISMLTYLYEEYGIAFGPTNYDLPRAEKIAALKRLGLRMGIPIGDRFLGAQPKCKAGELYYLPYLIFHQPPRHDEHLVGAFIRDKSLLVRQFLADRGAFPNNGET